MIVGTVFQQIRTSFVEQGIASGGPYDNAASYPRTVAVFIVVCLIAQYLLPELPEEDAGDIPDQIDRSDIIRAGALLGIFLAYLFGMSLFGYHLATPAMIFSIMLLCGERRWVFVIAVSLASSLVVSFVFEKLLHVVLPGGMFHIFIPW